MANEERFSAVFLSAAFEAAPSGLLVADVNGRIVLVNREVERLTGYSRGELIGKAVDDLVPMRSRGDHPARRIAFVADPTARAMAAGRELRALRKDGREVPVEIGLTPVNTPEGLFVISSIVDISARRRSDERFRAAVDRAPNGVLLTGETGEIVLVNREVERMFGYDRSELLGKQVEELVPARYRQHHLGFREGFARKPAGRGMGGGQSLFGLRRDGSEFPVEIGLNPIETEDGLCVLASIVDVSIREEAERGRQELEAQLRQSQKLEAVGTLAGGIAHDINNVFGAIVGFAELAAGELTEPAPKLTQVTEDLRELLVATDRGREIVRRILLFSRKQELSLRSVDLGSELRDTLLLLRRTLPKSIDFKVSVPAKLPAINADLTSLHQVLVNLATNAAHAMPHGGTLEVVAHELQVEASEAERVMGLHAGPYVAIDVRDDGAGMDAVTLSRAFEPFFTTKRQGEGTGLGLAMVRTILREHGGAIGLTSTPGEGTQARCYFPAVVSTLPASAVSADEIPRGRGERVLVVDDEAPLVRVALRQLNALGYEARGTTDPQEALRWIAEETKPFALLITDYAMPKMSGLDLSLAVHGLRPGLPIVMETGYASNAPKGELTRSGVRVVLAKPATQRERALAIRTLLDEQERKAEQS